VPARGVRTVDEKNPKRGGTTGGRRKHKIFFWKKKIENSTKEVRSKGASIYKDKTKIMRGKREDHLRSSV